MSVETLNHCPICHSDQLETVLNCKDYLVTQQEFSIQQCRLCSFQLTNPRPDENSIGTYYQSDEYISHSDTKQGLISQLYHKVRTITLRQKVSLINSLKSEKGHLLDIGCGSGYFLTAAQKDGWKVSGVEPNDDARMLAKASVNGEIAGTIHDLAQQPQYDVVTLWHVLEHVHRLDETMNWLKGHCQKKGFLIVAVPNHKAWDAQNYGAVWAAYDVPRHLYHFSPESMRRLMDKYGFRLIGQRPMLFDAFYVNLLSTKYRDGQPAYVESLLNGLRSNWAAYRNKGDYSSLIYVAQPK